MPEFPPETMMLETLKTTIAFPVQPGGSIRFVYPSGRTADSYQKHGEVLVLPDGTILKETADTLSVAYDAGGVSVACGSGRTIPVGTISLKLPLVAELLDTGSLPLTIGSVTDSVGNWIGKGGALIGGSATPVSVYGGASAPAATVATFTIPGGSIAPDSILETKGLFNFSGANAGRQVYVTLAGQNIGQAFPTATMGQLQFVHPVYVAPDLKTLTVFSQNLNDVASPGAGQGAAYSAKAAAKTTLTIDMTVDQVFAIKTTPVNGDIAELTGWSIENKRFGAVPSVRFAPSRALACWGDSITAGTGSSTITGGYPSRVMRGDQGRPVANMGIGGQTSQQIVDRLVADKVRGRLWNCVLEVGRNDVGSANLTSIVMTQLARAAANLASGVVPVIFTVTPTTAETTGTANANAINALNAQILATYGNNVLDIHALLCTQPDGTINPAWLFDTTHPNDTGYDQVDVALRAKLSALGI